MTISDLNPGEYGSYYLSYIKQNQNIPLLECLKSSKDTFIKLLESLPKEKLYFRYAEGKWSIAELVQHIIDAERVFQYRAMRFARNDQTPLPGFEQDGYVVASRANDKNVDQLKEEFTVVRDSTILFFKTLNKEELGHIGKASETNFSVRALGFIISGHQLHHENVIKERYL